MLDEIRGERSGHEAEKYGCQHTSVHGVILLPNCNLRNIVVGSLYPFRNPLNTKRRLL